MEKRAASLTIKYFRRKYVFLVLGILCMLYVWLWLDSTYDACQTENCDENIIKFNQVHFVNKTTKKILLWTKFFLESKWIKDVRIGLEKSEHDCMATANREEVGTADAVVFHYLDLWLWETKPDYRRPSQVWVIFNMEPPVHLHATGLPWKRVFNWTMMYRTDATVQHPYGEFTPLTPKEIIKATAKYKKMDFSVTKSKMVIAIISNCVDDVYRYRYIKELSKYVDIDYFGKCGNLSCDSPNGCSIEKYKFRLVFENSHCRDYVTEKFWITLQLNTVPIVNWKSNRKHFPRSSYINIHDFESAKDLGSYLNMLSTNKTLYNGFFEWKTKFKIDIQTTLDSFKYLCDALHTPHKVQTIIDPKIYMMNDSCRGWSLKEVARRHWNRFIFNLGF